MNANDLNEFQNEFEAMKQASQEACDTNGCVEDRYEDYPDYLRAIYAEVMPPQKSGVYFSRWDLKRMAEELGESFSIDVRERMFQKFMQWVATPEDMQKVIHEFTSLMDMKCDLYKDYSQRYPSSKASFDVKIEKVNDAKKYLDKVYVEFFT